MSDQVSVKYTKKPLYNSCPKEYYSNIASKYDLFYESTSHLSNEINSSLELDIVNIQKTLSGISSDNLIDLGSGTGYWRKFFKTINQLCLVDISTKMLELSVSEPVAAELLNRNLLEVHNANLFDFNFSTNHEFDIAFIGFVFSHYRDTEITALLNKIAGFGKIKKVIVLDSVFGKYRKDRLFKESFKNISTPLGNSSVFKRYFVYNEWNKLITHTGFHQSGAGNYWGETFFMSSLEFKS